MIVGIEIENGSCDPDHAYSGVVCHPYDIVYLCAKFNYSSFCLPFQVYHWGPKFKVGHVILTMSLLSVICYPYAGNCHSLPVYKI